MWLVYPPSDLIRTLGNEAVARELGHLGYTHIWMRYANLIQFAVHYGPRPLQILDRSANTPTTII